MHNLHVRSRVITRVGSHKKDVLMFCQTRARACQEQVQLLDRESATLIWRLLELLIKQNGVRAFSIPIAFPFLKKIFFVLIVFSYFFLHIFFFLNNVFLNLMDLLLILHWSCNYISSSLYGFFTNSKLIFPPSPSLW